MSNNLPRTTQEKPFGGLMVSLSFPLHHSSVSVVRVVGLALVVEGLDPKASLELL